MAIVEINISTVLQNVVGSPKCIQAEGHTVGQVLKQIENKFPGFKRRITGEQGELNQFIIIFINDQDIRFKDELETPLQDGDIIYILPAIAGG